MKSSVAVDVDGRRRISASRYNGTDDTAIVAATTRALLIAAAWLAAT